MMSATGTYEHSLDAKGRLFIPAQLRRELGDTLYVTMGIDGCLAVYPQETWDTFTAKFHPDSQGRIFIPARLRKFAGLEKDAVITGVHNRAEIWSAERWQEKQEEITPEKMNAILKGLGL